MRSHENAMWSLAPHDISLLLFFCNAFPKKISYNGFKLLGRDIEDSSISSFNFPDNIGAHIFVSWLHPFKEHRFVVVGSKGMFLYEDSSKDKSLLFYEKGIDFINEDDFVSLEVEAGDMVIFSSFLIHRSGNNKTESIRWSMHYRYNDAAEQFRVIEIRIIFCSPPFFKVVDPGLI